MNTFVNFSLKGLTFHQRKDTCFFLQPWVLLFFTVLFYFLFQIQIIKPNYKLAW